jgi:hypothetical protein
VYDVNVGCNKSTKDVSVRPVVAESISNYFSCLRKFLSHFVRGNPWVNQFEFFEKCIGLYLG